MQASPWPLLYLRTHIYGQLDLGTRSKKAICLLIADYVDFLMSVTPENQEEFQMQMRRFNLGPVGEADCPVFDGMFEFFRTYCGGSVGGATMLNDNQAGGWGRLGGAGWGLGWGRVGGCRLRGGEGVA